jgi:hypothetical protein
MKITSFFHLLQKFYYYFYTLNTVIYNINFHEANIKVKPQ